MIHAGADNFPLLTEITDFQMTVIDEDTKTKQIEIDLLGKNAKKILLVGECKFKNTQFDKTEYEKLLDKICVCFKSNDLHFFTQRIFRLCKRKCEKLHVDWN